MNSPRQYCVRFRKYVLEYWTATSRSVRAVPLMVAGLAALPLLLISACDSSTTVVPAPHRRPSPTPTATLTPTIAPTPRAVLLPPVILQEPEDGACLAYQSEVALHWSRPYRLEGDETYQLWLDGPDPLLVYHEENDFVLSALSPGEYNWGVTVVRSVSSDAYEPVSEESTVYRFRVASPGPTVYGISPATIVQGTSAPVVVSGENFTSSLAITIGIPLQAAFVNSTTITTTIPATLEVGEYPVVLRNSLGQGDSYVSFMVSEPTTSIPTVTPAPVYPPPELITVDIIGCNVVFYWTWARELAQDEYFALRAGIGYPGNSKSWTKDTQYAWSLREAGEYVWEIAICRGDPAYARCEQLAVSEPAIFAFRGCSE